MRLLTPNREAPDPEQIGLLTRGCLDRRIATPGRMAAEVKAYLERKNANPVPIKW